MTIFLKNEMLRCPPLKRLSIYTLLSERFVKRETINMSCNTRGSYMNLFVPKPNTNFVKYILAIDYSVAAAWHSIPVDIRLVV